MARQRLPLDQRTHITLGEFFVALLSPNSDTARRVAQIGEQRQAELARRSASAMEGRGFKSGPWRNSESRHRHEAAVVGPGATRGERVRL